MTTQQIADRLVELCRGGKYDQVFEELYSPDVVSIEPEGVPDNVTKGLEGLAKKGSEWQDSIETIHSGSVSDPVVGDSFFACNMTTKVTFKGSTEPMELNEICLYEVRNGKVVKEQFYYEVASELV